MIGKQQFGQLFKKQNFARHEIGGEILTILVFILDYFQQIETS